MPKAEVAVTRKEINMQTTPIENQTLTGSGSVVIENTGAFETIAEILVAVTDTPTGISPKLTITVDFSDDNVTYPADMAYVLPSITSELSYKLRQVIEDITEKFIRISWHVSAGASFPGCTVFLNGCDHFYTIYLDGKNTA